MGTRVSLAWVMEVHYPITQEIQREQIGERKSDGSLVTVGATIVEGSGASEGYCRVYGPPPLCPVGFGVKVVSHHIPVLLKWALE